MSLPNQRQAACVGQLVMTRLACCVVASHGPPKKTAPRRVFELAQTGTIDMQSPAAVSPPAGLCCSDAEVTNSRFSLPRAAPFLHANDVLSARSLTLEP